MNTYSIIMVGPRGSGKTVFLASMYKKLSTQGDLGFFLTVDGQENSNYLHDIYTEMALQKWPLATQASQLSELTFTCKVQTNNLSNYAACSFTYIDYAGGRLENLDKQDQELKNKLESADIMLGLLDGQKIVALMQNQKDGTLWGINTLPKILTIVQSYAKPLQFVISKWDIVEQYYTLKEVINFLVNEVEEFRNIVQRDGNGRLPMRVIPVSSVGPNFANLQLDGSMKIRSGAIPKPFQVEVPLGCVIPDLIQVLINKQIKKEGELKKHEEVTPNLNWWEQAGKMWGETVNLAVDIIPVILDFFIPNKIEFAKEKFLALLKYTAELATAPAKEKEKIAARRTQELKMEKEEALRKVIDEKTALESCLNSFLVIQSDLEAKFPASRL